ncbi:MAG TPA: DoxX family protein [Polyangia bacterium]|nr:DoxX family protein [Polyangia bacterium]
MSKDVASLTREPMQRRPFFRLLDTSAPGPALFVRVIVGWVFLSEGIQKFLFPGTLGVGRFIKIGIPSPAFTAPFVGVVEIVAGTLIAFGFLTRLAAIALLIDIAVAIARTKVPMLVQKGFWSTMHEARTDLAMAFCLVFLLWSGGGIWSVDERLLRRSR